MKLEVYGFNAFGSAKDVFGTPTSIFYLQHSGVVNKAVAIAAKGAVLATDIDNSVTAFVTAYPSAVELPISFDIGG